MPEYIVEAFGTLHKDVLVSADSPEDARNLVDAAFSNGELEFGLSDLVEDGNDYDVLTPEEAEALDGVAIDGCERLPG